MENLTKILNILFQRLPAAELGEQSCEIQGNAGKSQKVNQIFQRYAAQDLSGYSADELNMIFHHLQQDNSKLTDFDGDMSTLPGIALSTVIHFSEKVLRIMGNAPRCKIEQVGNWRKAFLALGQDVFVCAFLAREDRRKCKNRLDLTWPAVIRTDHRGLNTLLDQGLAENHQHLYGSSQSFPLNWCCMMNFPEDHHLIGKEFDVFLQPQIHRNAVSDLLSSRKRVEYACFLRAELFRWLKSDNMESEFEKKLQYGMWTVEQNLIRMLRQLYGAEVPQPDGGAECLDYALEHQVFRAAPDAHYRVLAGERNFLYRCFLEYLDGRMGPGIQMAFYKYLVLKTQFRSEFIQVNRFVGFQNFADYQDRKTALFDHRSCYWAELMRMALNAPLTEGSVGSLETRVIPRKSTPATIRRIEEADELKQYADREVGKNYPNGTGDEKPNEDSPFFYVMHYAKKKDPDCEKRGLMDVVCRHQALRKDIRRQSLAMARALSQNAYFASRVRGIDSAANEIGCPPEVFAQAYRFMRGYRDTDFQSGCGLAPKVTRRLSVSYHVGEDFLDIASALRAIDEAVNFLCMERGDRIGHALGLGVSPELHYRLKGHRIYLPKQDRLDDLVWLLFRSRELGARMDPHLYGCLKAEAETLLIEIYGDAINGEGWNISLTDYHCAMALRGDDPNCYRGKCFRNHSGLTPYDEFALSTHNTNLVTHRSYEPFSGLYFYYQFDNEVKRRGSKVITCDIGDDYIRLMRYVQQKLQERIEQLGIVVECNPSSNVLIGTFQTYRNHPIFRFHDGGLVEGDPDSAGPNLEVCVNTDDLGVFDTSLEFEYALLFDALCQEKKPDGTNQYSQEQILQYLEKLREMGFAAVFPNNRNEGAKVGARRASFRTASNQREHIIPII